MKKRKWLRKWVEIYLYTGVNKQQKEKFVKDLYTAKNESRTAD